MRLPAGPAKWIVVAALAIFLAVGYMMLISSSGLRFSLVIVGAALALFILLTLVLFRAGPAGPSAPAASTPTLRRTPVRLGIALLGLALAVHALFVAFGPEIRNGLPLACRAEPQFYIEAQDTWFAIRDPQLGGAAPVYDARNDTTLIGVGCDHDGHDFALRLRGDQTGLGDTYRILVAPESWPPSNEFIPLNASTGPAASGTPTRATQAVFVVRSPAMHITVNVFVAMGAAVGLTLILLWPWTRCAASAAGAAAGTLVGLLRLNAGYGLIDVLLLLPAALLILIVGAGMAVNTRPTSDRRAFALGLILFALCAIFIFARLVDAFPTYPDA